jgi:hypothetical protein
MAESCYVIPCPCGHEIRSHAPDALCPRCGTWLIVQNWGQPPTEADNRAALAFFDAERRKAKGATE